MEEQNLVYLLDGKIYINLTNKCTNECVFCIRTLKDDVCGTNLWLKNDIVTAKEVIEQLKTLVKKENESGSRCEPELTCEEQVKQGEHNDSEVKVCEANFTGAKEIVFCGYGEPTLKLEVLKEVAQFIKNNYKNIKIRLNTNGHANFVYKRNIIPELVGLVDEISVSLNAPTEELYKELSQPNVVCENILAEVKDFIKKSVDAGIETTASVVDGYKNYDINIKECENIALEAGAKFRVRKWLKEGY
ncbi:MAG: TatD family nuclease-associated radical SAM protein [Candidatus Gastranaerophilales bacterium]|nr:TatD family nuclease-associated radical SAM protein [Candidatus Gastranaerophilales bacterium]